MLNWMKKCVLFFQTTDSKMCLNNSGNGAALYMIIILNIPIIPKVCFYTSLTPNRFN